MRQYSKKWLSWNWKICHLVVKFIQSNYYLLKFSLYFLLPIWKSNLIVNFRKILIEETYKTLLPGKQDNSVSPIWIWIFPPKHTHTIQIFRKCNWNFIQPIMHGLEIQRVFTYCCCWCHPSGQYFFNLSSIYIYAINFEINEKEIATFLIVQIGFVCGFQTL